MSGAYAAAASRSTCGDGVGEQLLRFVLALATRMAGEVGCAGVVVDAKPGAVGFYAKYGFTPFDPLEGLSDARPRPTPMWLPMRASPHECAACDDGTSSDRDPARATVGRVRTPR